MPEKRINKKALIIVAFEGFQDKEYQGTRKGIEEAGAKITIASTKLGKAKGKYGSEIEVDKILDEINVDDYDLISFIGGPGARALWDNQEALRIAKQAVEKDKIVSAICIAPGILARAGILKGKKATVWATPIDQEGPEEFKKQGAIYIDQDVVVDENIITANGPAAAEKFGKKLGEILLNK